MESQKHQGFEHRKVVLGFGFGVELALEGVWFLWCVFVGGGGGGGGGPIALKKKKNT